MFLACHSNVSGSHGESLSVLLFALAGFVE